MHLPTQPVHILSLVLGTFLLVGPVARPCWGIFANIGNDVPVERLVDNIEQYVEDHPAEAHGYYLLGRVHAMAFAKKARVVRVAQPDWDEPLDPESNPFKFSPYDRVQVKTVFSGAELPEEARDHLMASVRNYRLAVELDAAAPDGPDKFHDEQFYLLGLGWMLEMGAEWAAQLGRPPVFGEPPQPDNDAEARVRQLLAQLATADRNGREGLLRKIEASLPEGILALLKAADRNSGDKELQAAAAEALKYHWLQSALEVYRQAYQRHIEEDMKLKGMYWKNETEDVVSLEAAEGIERILAARGQLTAEEKAELAEVREKIKHFNSLPQPITPIIIGHEARQPLSDLLFDERTVRFDLDGTGRGHRWPWVKPDTGILVWNPAETGRITSGRQLFGSVTWWLFWDDGYDALAALDDDGNGKLTGRELAGIAVWRDRNSDGISDPGEVDQVTDLGIVRIATKGRLNRDGVLSHPRGIELESGQTLPTYDWVPTSLP